MVIITLSVTVDSFPALFIVSKLLIIAMVRP